MIAYGLSIGIGKRALLEDYYPDELQAVFGEYNVLHRPDQGDQDIEMGPTEFLGGEGERLG